MSGRKNGAWALVVAIGLVTSARSSYGVEVPTAGEAPGSAFPAIQAYSEGAYSKIHYEESDAANALRLQLAAELATLPAEPGEVWHGACVSVEELASYETGSEKTYRFLSTTKIASIAFNYGNVRFSQSGHTCKPILLRLQQRTGRSIKEFSAFPKEEEVLLGPADKFTVSANPPLEKLPADVVGFLKQFNRMGVFRYFELNQIN